MTKRSPRKPVMTNLDSNQLVAVQGGSIFSFVTSAIKNATKEQTYMTYELENTLVSS